MLGACNGRCRAGLVCQRTSLSGADSARTRTRGGQHETSGQESRRDAEARSRRAALTALTAVGPAIALVSADDDPPDEAYPPATTVKPVTPTTRPIPKTGNDGTETWVKVGAGALLVGGLMVAGASRRRREVEA